MTPQQLRAIASRLFGEEWQTPLARVLGVAVTTVHRWASGARGIPLHAVEVLTAVTEQLDRIEAELLPREIPIEQGPGQEVAAAVLRAAFERRGFKVRVVRRTKPPN